MWIIVKYIKNKRGKELPVVILDSQAEVLEFETFGEAERTKNIFMINSDSGHNYVVKEI
jgi:hypothetical protein